jgi:hypothetical protein
VLWSLLFHLLWFGILLGAEKRVQQHVQEVPGQHVPDHLPPELLPPARPVQRLRWLQPHVQEVHSLPHVPGQLPRRVSHRGGHHQPLLRHPEVQKVHPLHVRVNLPQQLLPPARHHQCVLRLQSHVRQVHSLPQLRHQLPLRVLLHGAGYQQPLQCQTRQHVPEVQHVQLSPRNPKPLQCPAADLPPKDHRNRHLHRPQRLPQVLGVPLSPLMTLHGNALS